MIFAALLGVGDSATMETMTEGMRRPSGSVFSGPEETWNA
jgi:hypothetical protein